MNPWILLGFAIVIEVLGSNCIKASNGFTKPLPTVISIVAFVVALYLLSMITKTLPLGIVYAVWSGVGIVLTTLVAARFWAKTRFTECNWNGVNYRRGAGN